MKYISFKLTRRMLFNSIIIIMLIIMLITYVVSKVMDIPVVSGQRVLPIYCVDNNSKQIAITFDAAWDAEDTDQLISILHKYKAKAAFFCVGSWIDANPDAVKQLCDAGHIIANHSNAHKHLDSLSESEFLEDVRACNDKIKAITGRENKYYRGPYGEYNDTCVNAIRRIGMEYVQWNCDSIDWKEGITVDQIVKNTMKNMSSGSILLFHNGLKNTPEALEIILKDLSEQGYRFVSLDELLIAENYYIDHNGRQFYHG